MRTNFDLVAEAIRQRQTIIASYNGYPRVMCPHTLGYNRAGRAQALFYQYAGESSSVLGSPGSPRNWRCIPVEEMAGVEVIDGPWQTAPNHSRPQTCVARIVAEVNP